MLQYALKRILLVPPTFFMISLVIFCVLNVAPGRPGAASSSASLGESTNSGNQKESFMLFKQQFDLDKPILLNTRFRLDDGDIRERIVVAYNVDDTYTAKRRIAAIEDLDDYGNVMVQHLIVLLDDSEAVVQRLAAKHLVSAAQLRLMPTWAGDDDTVRLENRRIVRENEQVKEWTWEEQATDAEIEAIKASWKAWYAERTDLYTYTTGEKARMFAFETRFAKYWSNLIHLDFGVSNVDRRPVFTTIVSKLKYSLSLTVVSILIAYLIAVPIGIFSAVRQNTVEDSVITVGLFMMYSLPTFFTGTVLLRLLTTGDPFAFFPTGNFASMETGGMTTIERTGDILWHLVLPIATYTSVALAALSRYARTGVIDVIRADYIRTARAKGVAEPVVIIKHAARNGMIPILTLLGGLLPALVGGSVVIEVIFNIPGMGLFLFDSINLRDYNAVMGVLLCSAVLAQVGILLSDLSYALVDPRISFD